jgi:hypothetical protein
MGKTNFDIVEANSFVGPDGPITSEDGSVTIPNPLEVDIIGNVTGNVEGNVTGNVTGGIVGTVIDTPDATATASTETVDKDEFAAVVALVNACKAKINSIIVVEDED